MRICLAAATVDSKGDLLFVLFDKGDPHTYEIAHTNKEIDLSQIKAKYTFKNKRLFTINVLSDNSLYFFYLPSENTECNWYDKSQMEREGKKIKT